MSGSKPPALPPVRAEAAKNPTKTSFLRRLLCLLDCADFNVSEGDLAVIALQRDVSFVELRKKRHPAKFALGHALFEVLAPKHILKIFHTVDFMLAFLRSDQQPD